MFKIYHLNMLNFAVYVGSIYELDFGHAVALLRYDIRCGRISGWQIIRESDDVVIAQSKAAKP